MIPTTSKDEELPTRLQVRPYLVTGGRTSATHELPLESLLRIADQGDASPTDLVLEPALIVEQCAEPISVAELAARLELPIQVVRVLVGDLIDLGLIQVQSTPVARTERPDLNLLERVLDGLQSL